MILSVEEVKALPEFHAKTEEELRNLLDALESFVRKYTNNNFQNRSIRFLAASIDNKLDGVSPYLKVGDTIQISESGVNDGLYVVQGFTKDITLIDKDIFDCDHNLVTKVEYPAAIKQGVINLMKWEVENREKVGIQSETLSRHTVSYYNLDSGNSAMGYPVSLLGFLKMYKKARF